MLSPEWGCQPWGVGINCTKIEKMDQLVRSYEAAIRKLLTEAVITEWPALVLYPDGTNGEVYNTTTQRWEISGNAAQQTALPTWEDQLTAVVRGTETRGSWKSIVVGGCCMAGPDAIARLRTSLEP